MKEVNLAVDNRVLQEDAKGALDYVELNDDFVSSIGFYRDSIKKAILALAAEGSYETAKQELKFYQETNNKIPGFRVRTEHYFNHIKELLDAIQNLKNFPNFDALRAAQQKQIRERIITYAEDLSSVLGRIDKVTNDLKIQDVRSTLWVVRAFSIMIMVIFMCLAVKEAIHIAPTPEGIFVIIEDRMFSAIGW
tara:strand:- start:1875 stop:2453 length:579 start_codon:yes stop_codon:yes gene_type:complete